MLYYTDKDPLSQPDLTLVQIQKEIFDKLVKIVPRLSAKEKEGAQSIVAFRVVRARPISSNNEFQTIAINFEIFVPLT